MIRACSRSRLRNPGVGNGSAFNPLSLFTAGEQGVWFDPSDLTTLFQDDAGTVPVTTDGQAVALMRDKSGNAHHAAQTVAGSRPIFRTSAGLSWLEFDGADDFMVTASTNFTATDSVSAFFGVRKLTDASVGIITELSPDSNVNDGSFFMASSTGLDGSYTFAARASALVSRKGMTFTAPITNVLSGLTILRVSEELRVNGTVFTGAAPAHGAGNFGAYPIYIGRRNGTVFPFSGSIYGIIIRGIASSATTVLGAESYMATKSGVVLP